MKRIPSWLFVVLLAIPIGCEPPKSQDSQGTAQSPAAVPTSVTPEPASQPAVATSPAAPRVAEVGVGIKGKSLEGETGVGKIIASPAVAYFKVREKAVFEIQIPHAMQLFNGLEGRFPKTHEEFMEKIVKANQIKLPQLPQGQQYRYHPDDQQLWVEPVASK